jgi:hypothetical protein
MVNEPNGSSVEYFRLLFCRAYAIMDGAVAEGNQGLKANSPEGFKRLFPASRSRQADYGLPNSSDGGDSLGFRVADAMVFASRSKLIRSMPRST